MYFVFSFYETFLKDGNSTNLDEESDENVVDLNPDPFFCSQQVVAKSWNRHFVITLLITLESDISTSKII